MGVEASLYLLLPGRATARCEHVAGIFLDHTDPPSEYASTGSGPPVSRASPSPQAHLMDRGACTPYRCDLGDVWPPASVGKWLYTPCPGAMSI